MSPPAPPGGSPEPTVAVQAAADAAASATPEFLTSLVDAMRRVVESTRDTTLAELKATADEEIGQLDAKRAAREATLSERSELDINAIGAWERAEIERIRSEAVAKVAARREQFDREMAELSASSDAERAALLDRAGAYERDTAVFMKELAGIKDPAAFAAIAGRMPPPPQHGNASAGAPSAAATPANDPAASPAAAPTTTPAGSEPHEMSAPAIAERLAALNTHAGTPTEPPVPQGEEVATAIEVHGLGSFGAITSLKQSLERVSGIRSVALALGPGGDFVYTAIHVAGFDLAGAIRAIEGEAVQIDGDNGTLRVKVARGAA